MQKFKRAIPLLVVGALALPYLALSAPSQSDFMSEHMPYAAFDELKTMPIAVNGGTLHVGFAPGAFALPQAEILAWLERSARAVSIYYGRFPASSVRLLIVPVPGTGVSGGQAFGYRGAAIRLMVGRDSTAEDLKQDWKAVHEMVHLALPDVDDSQLWLAEGLAVYIESIARVQAGDLSPRKIWTDFVRDMPKGLPKTGDRGLDQTPTWGRRYWGGAIFCLQADVEIRKRTNNRVGLQQALRGLLAGGATHEEDWPAERIFKVADAATGTTVLTEMYEQQRNKPVTADLDALWRDLGIADSGSGVTFDDKAPLAAIRKQIEAREPAAADSK